MSGDEPITALRCIGCNKPMLEGTGDAADKCPHCFRKLTPRQLEISQRRRSSGTAPGLIGAGEALVARLRADGRGQAAKLAEQLEDVVVTLRGWTASPPTGDESVKVHKRMLELVRAGEDLLSGRVGR